MMRQIESSGIEMLLPARAENVSLVRHAIAGSAEALGMSDSELADLKTVVTEACMNVVQHAYDEAGGPMEIRAWENAGHFVVSVTDRGHGMSPRADLNGDSLHLGLSLIASMADGFEISGGSGIGTRVTVKLPLTRSSDDQGDAAEGAATSRRDRLENEVQQYLNGNGSGVALFAWSMDALPPILARVIGVLGARSDMSIDELSDAVLFSDAVTADFTRNAPDDRIEVLLDERDDGIELRVGPLADGGVAKLRQSLTLPDELGGSLESLADLVTVEDDERGEFLLARFGRSATAT